MEERYGLPVFGRVRQENTVAETVYGKVMGENRNGVAVFPGGFPTEEAVTQLIGFCLQGSRNHGQE